MYQMMAAREATVTAQVKDRYEETTCETRADVSSVTSLKRVKLEVKHQLTSDKHEVRLSLDT